MLQDQSETADTALNEWSIEDMDDILNILPVDQSENAVMSSSSSRQLGNTPKHGKTHVCQRCNLKFRSYDAYVSHRMTHRSATPQDNETAGPSGMRSSHVNPNHPRSSATEPSIDDDSQGGIQECKKQEQTGTKRRCCSSLFLEAEYKAHLEYPVGIVGPSKVAVKKTQDGWLVYDRRTDTWEPLKTGVQISKKMAIQSGLAQVPSEGYIRRHTFSKASIQWLEYQMEIARRDGESLHIQHALNGGEAIILGTHYKVDGLAGNIVYEFHGKCSNLICSC
ncbi:hypothetical protein ACF0H5_001160 [Mactra antiquata]